jgi:hypothetical protein
LTRIKTTGEGAAELKKALLKREIIHNAKKQPAQLFRLFLPQQPLPQSR